MSGDVTLELAIDTKDEQTLRAIEEALGDVGPRRWPETRDILTVITVASGTDALVDALLSLKSRFGQEPAAPPIVIKNVDRLALTLPEATPESLRELIEG
jgi:hypothetical protein